MGPRVQYLTLLLLCLAGTAFLEFRFDARVWRRPLSVARALVVPWVLFNVVNEVSVFRGLWWYNPNYITGWRVPRRYPIEEMAFFVVVPLCALLTFEAASAVYDGRVVAPWARPSPTGRPARPAPPRPDRAPNPRIRTTVVAGAALLITGLALLAAMVQEARTDPIVRSEVRHEYALLSDRFDYNLPEYPIIVMLLLALVLVVELGWWRTGILRMRAYWSTMAICLCFMVPVNGWLTKLSAPVVIYAQDEFSGLRPIWDIPFEDVGFAISLLTLVLMSWVRVIRRTGPVAEP